MYNLISYIYNLIIYIHIYIYKISYNLIYHSDALLSSLGFWEVVYFLYFEVQNLSLADVLFALAHIGTFPVQYINFASTYFIIFTLYIL